MVDSVIQGQNSQHKSIIDLGNNMLFKKLLKTLRGGGISGYMYTQESGPRVKRDGTYGAI